MKKELIAHEDPKSYVSELFRTLRTNVQFMNSNNKLETLLITSTLPGEGKTWIASNLAIAFAQADKRVILIDADMRKCRLHKIFKVSSCPGLSNYLAGVNENDNEKNNLESYLRETDIPNLHLMPAGNVPPNPSELLVTTQMMDLLTTLKKEYDLIIIDGTPSKLVTDAIILSRIVDSTIIVAGHNMAKKEDLAKIVRDIKNVGGKIAGVVYNQKPISSKKSNETYYYDATSMKMDLNKKRIKQHSVTDMLNREQKTSEISKNIDVQEIGKVAGIGEDTVDESNSKDSANTEQHFDSEKLPGERTAEILKQFNDYLQKEKENRDKNRS